MRDIKLYYKNKKDVEVLIEKELYQYIYLEPLSSAVVRYVIKKAHEHVEADTKLSNEVKEPEVVSVKFLAPKTPFLSKKSEFDAVEERTKKVITLTLNFDNSGTYILDALYTNLLDEKVKVKVIAHDTADTIIENEHSYVDAPDDFVRVVGVEIDPTGVEYTALFRRNGRLQKCADKATYEEIARLVKNILFSETAYYSKVPRPTYDFNQEPKPQSVIDALILAGWEVSLSNIERVDPSTRKKVQISDEELGKIIKENITVADLASLFKPKDLTNNGHFLIQEGNNFLSPCDSTCSLPEVTPKLVIDQRG